MQPELYFATFASGRPCWKRASSRLEIEARRFSFVRILPAGSMLTTVDFEGMRYPLSNFVSGSKTKLGFFRWKPLFIWHILSHVPKDAIIMYLDAGCTLNSNEASEARLRQYMELATETHGVFFQTQFPEQEWTKGEVLDFFSASPSARNSGQIMGGVMLLRNSDQVQSLVREWVRLALEGGQSLFSDNTRASNPTLIEHRHDQSVLSVMIKMKFKSMTVLDDETYFYPKWSEAGRDFPIWTTRLCSGWALTGDDILSKVIRNLERRLPL